MYFHPTPLPTFPQDSCSLFSESSFTCLSHRPGQICPPVKSRVSPIFKRGLGKGWARVGGGGDRLATEISRNRDTAGREETERERETERQTTTLLGRGAKRGDACTHTGKGCLSQDHGHTGWVGHQGGVSLQGGPGPIFSSSRGPSTQQTLPHQAMVDWGFGEGGAP